MSQRIIAMRNRPMEMKTPGLRAGGEVDLREITVSSKRSSYRALAAQKAQGHLRGRIGLCQDG